MDKGLTPNEEGRGTIHEDDSTINHRVCRCISNATQERDIDSHHKGKTLRTIFQVLVVMMVIMGAVSGVVALVGIVEELVALVRVLEEMVVLVAVMLVK